MKESVILENGKYEVVFEDNKLSALRYGEPWRDLLGDNLVCAMMQEIIELRQNIQRMKGDK